MKFTSHATLYSAGAVLLATVSVTQAQQKALVIAIDGLRPDALAVANTPNIDSLLDGAFFNIAGPSGIFAQNAQSEDLTFSGPGWTSVLTGVHRDVHTVNSNSYSPSSAVPDMFAPLEAHNSSLNTYRLLTWRIADTNTPSGADVRINNEYNANGDVLMTQNAVALMSGTHGTYSADPDSMFMFYSDTDAAGHSSGFSPTSATYLAEIANVDSQIGQVMTAIGNRANFANEDWLVIITSDHGGSPDGGHSGNTPEKRTIPFIVAGKSVDPNAPISNPRQVDAASTMLAHFGAPIPAGLDGHVVGLASSGPQTPALEQNLIFNGDAEFDRGFTSNNFDQYASGWDDPGPNQMNILTYDAPNGFPSASDPGPSDRGDNFFSGGQSEESTMTQLVDVSNLAALIDTGEVDFHLSGWLGGYASQDDRTQLTARFLDENESELGSAILPAVTAADRSNQTGLLYRELFGDLPTTTRFVEFELYALRTGGGENDGYADNLSFVLTPEPNSLLLLGFGGLMLFKRKRSY